MEHAIEAGAEDVSHNEEENTFEVSIIYSESLFSIIDVLSSSLMLETCSWSRRSLHSKITKF